MADNSPHQSSLSKALGALSQGHLSDAEDICRTILQDEPTQPDALHLMGLISYRAGDVARCVDLISQAISSRPGFLDALLNLGNIYKEINAPVDAENCYRNVLSIQPGNVLACNHLAEVLLAQGNLEAAIEMLDQSLQTDNRHPDTHFNLAKLFVNLGDTDQALVAFNNVISLNPNFTIAHNDLGLLHLELGNFEDAQACFQKALALEPEYVAALNHLGLVYKDVGEFDKALHCFTSALSIKPDYYLAYSNLMIVLRAICGEDHGNSESTQFIENVVSNLPDLSENNSKVR